MQRSRAVTSADVARLAGVSRAVVSIVLNGARSNTRVAEQTRQRVIEAASTLQYIPHPAAQALRRQWSGIIGYVPRPVHNGSTVSLIRYQVSRHIADMATRSGSHIVEVSSEVETANADQGFISFLVGHRVDGVIIDSPATASVVQGVIDAGLPIVQIVRPQFSVPTPTVTVDATDGIMQAIRHLVMQGHRTIAFLGHGGPHRIDQRLLSLYRAALTSHHIPINEDFVCFTYEYSLEAGLEGMQRLLSTPDRPTALFAAGDTLAAGALQALYDARIRVPDDMSVIAYDDSLAPYLSPRLTCIPQPFAEVAECAVKLLTAMRDTLTPQADEMPHIVLPTQFTVRESTRPL